MFYYLRNIVIVLLMTTSCGTQIITGQYVPYPYYNIWNFVDAVPPTTTSTTSTTTTTTIPFTTNSYTNFKFIDDDLSILVEGDTCAKHDTGEYGLCLPTSKCKQVLDDFRQGIKPQICSFSAREAIVCCPQKKEIINIIDRGDTTSTPYIRPSVQKCKEYSKLGVHKDSFISLEVNPSIQNIEIPVCEYVYNTGLIVGGESAKPGEFPHMAAIGWADGNNINYNCGGTLISDEFVMTAGHCAALHGLIPDVVRLGAHILNKIEESNLPYDFRIVEIIKHPLYKRSSHYNDIALLRLDRKVIFNKFMRPACLWQSYNINTTKTVATGWGVVEFAGLRSDELLKVTLDITDNSYCNTLYDRTHRLQNGIINSQLCAGYVKGGKDTCQGDSGGPIQVITPHNKCIFHIIGITSFGKACAELNGFGVYTRISEFIDWIESVVWPI